jgi:hypothetical protein
MDIKRAGEQHFASICVWLLKSKDSFNYAWQTCVKFDNKGQQGQRNH